MKKLILKKTTLNNMEEGTFGLSKGRLIFCPKGENIFFDTDHSVVIDPNDDEVVVFNPKEFPATIRQFTKQYNDWLEVGND